ncbi:MAG: hypothetical protein Q7R39_10270 [Dehalococcoidia bacterium]|nr:hypothetical protein [Dehalococcoidia bacterium]
MPRNPKDLRPAKEMEGITLSENSSIKELLLRHPQALRVLLDRGVPVSCAGGTVAEAARVCGVAPRTLLADLGAVLVGHQLDQGAR